MKKILFILSIFTFLGCSDFLEEVDQDKLVPEKTDHYAALMLHEFNYAYPLFKSVYHMTDDVVEDPKAYTSAKFDYKTTYTWQREIEIDENGKTINTNGAWENMYEDIAIANYVIELIDEALGEQEEINFIKGEAYFIRALSYFNLLNLYGQPFNPSTANVELGVPLRDDIGVEATYNRNTVEEGYALIEKDLLLALENLTASNMTKSKWHPNIAACNLLMSRVKLYQEKWDDVIKYSNEVINSGSLSKMSTASPFITQGNEEVLYSYYTINPVFSLYTSGTTLDDSPYIVNNELVDLYDDNDIRKQAFFATVDDGTGKNTYRTKKHEPGLFTDLGFANFRVSEAYLNRAEAYAQKSDVANAINDIKELHNARYSNVSGVTYPSAADDVLTFVLNERRKEFCFEDHHRWFDLRRMENRPEIKHVFTLVENNGLKTGTETYTLLPNDLNYTLPIPIKERQNNPLIRNNERYEKIPVIDEAINI
ncbi:RagB/SusD family nutrient uptake outer membrane protein [Tenacibaculum aestuarii]|uniref:RagB/SusD family nutrient uptake outer membrane protein n=1 Tax=Tenacibaculum aestuarii TaxID=362781 RepID=UPI003893A433